MTRNRTWKNVPGILTIEYAEYSDIPDFLKTYAPFTEPPLVEIHFLSSGSYSPARMGRYPEDSWPSESEEERELDNVFIDGHKVERELARKLFDHYQKEVDVAHVDTVDTDDCW